MKCSKARSLAYLRSEGGATTREERLLDRHLSECEPCRAQVASIPPLLLEAVRSEVPLTERDFAEIRENVMTTVSVTSRNTGFARYRLLAASVLLLMVAAAGMMIVGNDSATPGRSLPVTERSTGQTEASPNAVDAIDTDVEPPMAISEELPVPQPSEAETLVASTGLAEATEAPPEPSENPIAVEEEAETGARVVRIELETSDPTVRIIWISSADGPRMDNEPRASNS